MSTESKGKQNIAPTRIVHIKFKNLFYFKSVLFEFDNFTGPTFLRRKDHELLSESSISGRTWAIFDKWCAMPPEEQKLYRVE